eukprot:s285_g12.t2
MALRIPSAPEAQVLEKDEVAPPMFQLLEAHVSVLQRTLNKWKGHLEAATPLAIGPGKKMMRECAFALGDFCQHELAKGQQQQELSQLQRQLQEALAKVASSEAQLLQLNAENQRSKLSNGSWCGPPVNIVLLGPPAGGKGTQAGYLAERYGMIHISMGDLLRARAKFLPQLAEYISQGELVPDDVVVSVLKERLADSDCFSRGVLLDGFPRTRAQAEALRNAGVDISAVIHLKVADEVVVDRISGRRIDPLSGKIYHVKDSPPPPEIQDRVIQREDDTPETIRRRLVTYHQERDAILDFCGDRVRTIHVGDGSPAALPADVRSMLVFDEVRKAVEGDTYWGSVIRSELIAKARSRQ